MSLRKELYFLILYFFLCQISYGQEFQEEFTTELSSGKYTSGCNFKIHFTDEKILGKSKVKCTKKPKKLMTIEHVHETKSMHILTLKLQIFKNGRGNIKEDSTVETSKIF